MAQRETDPEGFKPPRRINISTLIALGGILVGIGGAYAKAEIASQQAARVPELETSVAVLQADINYLKEGQNEQSEHLDELKKDMKEGFSEIKSLIQGRP